MKGLYLFFALFFLLNSCQKENKSSLNLELKKELSEIEFRDQILRTIDDETPQDSIIKYAKRLQINPELLKKSYQSLMTKYDAENQKRILAIIEQYGYPGIALVGTPENESAWIILQHSDPKTIEKFLPVLRKAKDNGDISMQALALTEDRNLMYQGKEQIYGSQTSRILVKDSKGKVQEKYIIWPIKDPGNVNKLRKQAGFVQSVEEYSKMVLGENFEYKAYTMAEINTMKVE